MTIHSRNEPMAKPLTSWIVPTFSQHNWCLVVSRCCSHISVTKFQDKFASLQQANSPNSWNKFQIRCTDIYLIRFLPNSAVFCMFLWISWDSAELPEFHGSATARNISIDSGASRGLFLDQTEARRAEKKFLETTLPQPLLPPLISESGWTLILRSGSTTDRHTMHVCSLLKR